MVLATVSDVGLVIVVALATAIGAGVGGVIAGRVTLRAEDRRQRFARRAEKRTEKRRRKSEAQAQARNLKEAARLVDEELRDATDLIRNAVFQGRWWAPPRQLSADVYTRYRHVLAVALDDSAWIDVSSAYQQFNHLNWERSKGIPSLADIGGAGDQMNPLERVDLLSVGLAIIEARQALAPSAAPPDRESLLSQAATDIAEAVFPVPEDLDEELGPLLEDDDDGRG